MPVRKRPASAPPKPPKSKAHRPRKPAPDVGPPSLSRAEVKPTAVVEARALEKPAADPPALATSAVAVPAETAAPPAPPSAVSAERPPTPTTASAERPPTPGIASRLAELFQLNPNERRVFTLLQSSEEPLRTSRVAAELGIELVSLLVMLALDSPLRAHGLIEVDQAAELGFLRPTDLLYPARGLHLVGHPSLTDSAVFSGQAPGITYLTAPPPGTDWAKDLLQDHSLSQGPQLPQVLELVRERLIASHPVLLWLSQCPPETVVPLSHAARLRLQRPILIIDGAALTGWSTPQLFAALRRLRRDADVRGAAVVVSEAQLLGSAWLALVLPRPKGQTAPVVLCSRTLLTPSGLPLPAGRDGAELVPQALTLRLPTVASAGSANAAGEAAAEDPATLASRDDARRRAAMDAARAMGKPIPTELFTTAAAAPLPAAPQRPAATPAASAAPAAPPAPAGAAAPATPAAPARPTNPRLAAALAKAGLPPAGGGAPPRSAPAPTASAPATSSAPPVATPESTPAATALAPADASGTTQPAETEAPAAVVDDQPPIPLADDAGPEELVRVARTTPNQAQRAEMLRKLTGTKSPSVIQLFRTNSQSSHPAVRAAAEAGMASLFGANWNRTRAIPPPVQPPRGEDNGRGPGGAF